MCTKYPLGKLVDILSKYTGEVIDTGFIEAYTTNNQNLNIVKVHSVSGDIIDVGLYLGSNLCIQDFEVNYTLTNRMKSNQPIQTIIGCVKLTGQNNLKFTSKGNPMPFAHIRLGNDNIILRCEGEKVKQLIQGQVVKISLENVKKRMRCHWTAILDEIIEIYNEV